MNEIIHIETINEIRKLLPKHSIKHPMVTVVNYVDFEDEIPEETKITMGFYGITFTEDCANKITYGLNPFDFQDGTLLCTAPRQSITLGKPSHAKKEGWGVYFHPDFIRGTSLGKKIKEYSFFSYQVNEALHLSEKEKQHLSEIVQKIDAELSENIDKHSQMLLCSNIELLLNYCVRYYDRQFITRTNTNKDILSQIDYILADYFQQGTASEKGLPTVAFLAEKVHLSPNYLSDLLKRETGMNAQDRIHYLLIEEAKNMLLGTDKSVSELAYSLGFEYPQYFSRLFKNKTGKSPIEFRNAG